jgi:hypothetical protein
MAHCAKCGALLAPGAQFCSKCGTAVTVAPVEVATPVAPPVATPVTPGPVPRTPIPQATTAATSATAPEKRSTWWIVPLVIVGLVIVAWLLLAGLPFGGRDDKRIAATATTETIAEGTAPSARPMDSGTVVDVGTDTDQPLETTTIPPPPLATQTPAQVPVPQPSTAPPPNPVVIEQRPPVTQPRPTPAQPRPTPAQPRPTPVQPHPAPAPPPRDERAEEITDSEALSTLRGYLASNNPYDTSGDCLQTRSMGYKNVGYTFSVWDSCVEGGGSRMLGRWRVDSKTREVFRQGDDGRYLRP